MSSTLEKPSITPESDHDRFAGTELEREVETYRHQLDLRLSTPNLTDHQRDTIINESFQAIGRIHEEGILGVDGLPKVTFEESLFTPLDRLADLVDLDIKNITNEEHQQAVKYFCGALLEMIRQADVSGDQESVLSLMMAIEGAYLSSSPNLFMYAGNELSSFLELLAYSKRTPTTEFMLMSIEDELIYRGNHSKGLESLFDDQIFSNTPTAQLELLNTATSVTKRAIYADGPDQPFVTKTLEGLNRISNNIDETSAFVRIAGRSQVSELEQFTQKLELQRARLVSDPGRALKEVEYAMEEQERLRDQLSGQSGHEGFGWFDRVSSDAIGAIQASSVSLNVDLLITDSGQQVCLADSARRNDLNLSEQDAVLLRAIHNPSMKMLVEEELGVSLSSLTLDAQRHLLTFMVEAKPERYNRLTNTLVEAGDSRQAFAEAFLATEFGDDYGDILLDLAESADKKRLGEIIASIEQVRRAGARIAKQFESDDPLDQDIAGRIPTAFIKRTTELLALARQDGIESVSEPLSSIAMATKTIAESLESDSFSHADVTSEFGAFSSDASPVSVNSRPHGRNARLGFTVRGMGDDGKQRLNIRLDYEAGELSLDIGSTAKNGVNVSDVAALVGSSLARGEKALAQYRAEQSGEEIAEASLHGNHVREAFLDMPLLQPEEFAGVVNRFMYRLRNRGRLLKLGRHATGQQISAEMSQQPQG